jgi:ParB family transcriptional regulator, chromosome partitioning protein
MALDNTEPQEADLERTDRLPVLTLNPALIDEDVADDAVRLDMATVTPRIKNEFRRAPVDLPALVDGVRSAEERIARQKADFDALSRAHEKIRAAEQAAIARVNALTAELPTLRSALETEQTHARQLDKVLTEKTTTIDALRSRLEDAQHEIERHQVEARTLRDTLVARDATIVQVLHSLGERDAQLSALQREHARLVPALEERSRTGASLETELRNAVTRADALATDLRGAQASVATLTERIKSNEFELVAARRELSNVKLVAATHQERLRTREWREGFDQNQVRDLDAKLNAAQTDRGVLKHACDQLRQRVSELESKLASRDDAMAKLQAAAADDQAQGTRSESKASQVETERAATERAATGVKAELQRTQEQLATAEQAHATLRDEAARLQADLRTREEEMAVLHAHLELARRPPESADVETKRLMNELAAKTDEVAAKATALNQVNEENRNLNAALERTRAALEEREFLIRRLERSETNSANALGRIQTSIERMGSAPSLPSGVVSPAECMAEMVRIDGDNRSTHTLGRRTRIGRAPGCEIQVDSSSVSRHHALILVGMREVIVEDLNSTNGVLVNGRKVARQLLSDGDQLTIGDAQFKLYLKLEQRPPEPQSPPPAPETP